VVQAGFDPAEMRWKRNKGKSKASLAASAPGSDPNADANGSSSSPAAPNGSHRCVVVVPLILKCADTALVYSVVCLWHAARMHVLISMRRYNA